MLVIRRSDETFIETVSTNDELNILKASGCGLKILVELITLPGATPLETRDSQGDLKDPSWIWQESIRSKTERVNAPGFLVRGASLCFHPLG